MSLTITRCVLKGLGAEGRVRSAGVYRKTCADRMLGLLLQAPPMSREGQKDRPYLLARKITAAQNAKDKGSTGLPEEGKLCMRRQDKTVIWHYKARGAPCDTSPRVLVVLPEETEGSMHCYRGCQKLGPSALWLGSLFQKQPCPLLPDSPEVGPVGRRTVWKMKESRDFRLWLALRTPDLLRHNEDKCCYR